MTAAVAEATAANDMARQFNAGQTLPRSTV
jgi:hypothetical protein